MTIVQTPSAIGPGSVGTGATPSLVGLGRAYDNSPAGAIARVAATVLPTVGEH